MKKLLCLFCVLLALSVLLLSDLLADGEASGSDWIHEKATAEPTVRLRKPRPARVAEFLRIMHQDARAN
jgi:hypothetical protein